MKRFAIRSLSLLLALIIIASVLPTARAYSNVTQWAKPEVDAMQELGLIPSSLDTADLTQSISRLDMCRIAIRSYEKLTGTSVAVPDTHPFTDTTDPDVEKAYAAGLVKGRDNNMFCPNDKLSRLEFFAFVAQFISAVGYSTTDANYADISRFSDASGIPSWGYDYTRLTVGLGVVNGTGTALDWTSTTSAEQALAMFYRAYNVASGETVPPAQNNTPAQPDNTPPAAGRFPNLSGWAQESITAMDALGLVPESVAYSSMTGTITRGDMCKVAMLAYKQLMGVSDTDLGTPGTSPFVDTSDPDIINAARLGIVSGYGNGYFGVNDPISRQDYFKITVNFLNAIGYLYFDDETVELSAYPDSGTLREYAVSPARLLISIGAVNGDDSKNLHPESSIVCQEALAIFYRIHYFVVTWVASSAEDTRSEITREEVTSIVDFAKKYLGYSYVYGGKSPETGFDCSGFVYYVFKQFGYNLTPGADVQWKSLSVSIPRDQLLPGDLVFFSTNGSVSGISHVAIYIGNNQIIHASTPSTGVIISDLNEPYYVRTYLGGKRCVE